MKLVWVQFIKELLDPGSGVVERYGVVERFPERAGCRCSPANVETGSWRLSTTPPLPVVLV